MNDGPSRGKMQWKLQEEFRKVRGKRRKRVVEQGKIHRNNSKRSSRQSLNTMSQETGRQRKKGIGRMSMHKAAIVERES